MGESEGLVTAALKGGTLSWLVQPFTTEGEKPTYDPDKATLLSFRALGGGAAAPGGPAAGDGAGLAPSIRFLRRSRQTVLKRRGFAAGVRVPRGLQRAADGHARPRRCWRGRPSARGRRAGARRSRTCG